MSDIFRPDPGTPTFGWGKNPAWAYFIEHAVWEIGKIEYRFEISAPNGVTVEMSGEAKDRADAVRQIMDAAKKLGSLEYLGERPD